MIPEEKFTKLQNGRILIFGLGGVGGYVVEGLVRSGIEDLTLVDHDLVTLSNFNRQIIADDTNLNQLKTQAFSRRIKRINPQCRVDTVSSFILPEDLTVFDFKEYDFIVDAIDTVTSKLAIIKKAKQLDIPIISAMGFGNKLDPSKIRIDDISKTTICPLAKVMRRELRKMDIENVMVAYSTEIPYKASKMPASEEQKCEVGSFVSVVATAGFYMAAYVIAEISAKSE